MGNANEEKYIMSIKITENNLMELLKNIPEGKLESELRDFMQDIQDDYYFYGYTPLDPKYIEITIIQLGKILKGISDTKSTIYQIVNEIYQAGFLTDQQVVYLYGRKRK